MTYRDFAKIIKQKRIDLGLLQKDMAYKMAISLVRYNRIENAVSEPTFVELSYIVNILDIDLMEIIKKPIEHISLYD